MTDLNHFMAADDTVRGYIYQNGTREERWFKGSPENIASFLMRNQTADQITLTDTLDRLVLNSFGCFIDTCPDRELMGNVMEHLIPMQMGKTTPVAFETITNEELNRGALNKRSCTCIFRHGEDDFAIWDVDLPVSVIDQIKLGQRSTADCIEDLLRAMPNTNEHSTDTVSLLVWDRNELSLYTAAVSADFIEQYNYEGCSVRADLDAVVDEMEGPETEIDIMWDDLKPETQRRLMRMLGDNANYDTLPIATIYAPGMEQGMKM